MNQTIYQENRQQLLRRAAAGEDITKHIDKLDAEHAAAQRAQALAGDVDKTRQAIEREEARERLQGEYDGAAAAYQASAQQANEMVAHAEDLFAQAVEAFNEWRAAVEAARAIGSQAHHLQMQGAQPVKLPTMPNTGELSVHMLRRFGDGVWQQSLYGKLPRAS
ncbi:hypothetical protein PQR70_33715 [Paraburkholderia madseniana]|uniref:hypothetical protein n=1 Tax=Paraburkholderia madseniana TaxID=2599607 RepID=UPI0038B8688D